MAFFEFPHTRTYDSDLGWIIKTIRTLIDKVEHVSEITFADPIGWLISNQYPQNQIVKDPNSGILYLSKQPVPAGIALTNEEYWLEIGNFNYEISYLKDAISTIDEGTAIYANYDHPVNSYIWWNDKFYHVEKAISEGDLLVSGDNIVITSVGERLSKYPSGYWANVKDYGAKGDGVTDDTAAIRAAFSQTDFDTVVFPKGTYIVSGPIDVLRPNFSVIGYGACIKKDDYTRNLQMFRIRAYIAQQDLYNIRVEGLELDGSKPRSAAYDANILMPLLAIYSSDDYRMENIRIVNCYIHDNMGRGIGLDGGKTMWDPHITDTVIEGCTISYVWGGIVQSIVSTRIINCRIDHSNSESITVDNGCVNNQIIGCSLYRHYLGTGEIGVDATRELIIANNIINGAGSAGTEIASNGISLNCNRGVNRNVTITGNIIYNNAAYGIRTTKTDEYDPAQYLNVVGNNFMGNALADIYIDGLANRNYFTSNSYLNANRILLSDVSLINNIQTIDTTITLNSTAVAALLSEGWSIGSAAYTYIEFNGKSMTISGDFVKSSADAGAVILVLPTYLRPLQPCYIAATNVTACYIQASGNLRIEGVGSMALNANTRLTATIPCRI